MIDSKDNIIIIDFGEATEKQTNFDPSRNYCNPSKPLSKSKSVSKSVSKFKYKPLKKSNGTLRVPLLNSLTVNPRELFPVSNLRGYKPKFTPKTMTRKLSFTKSL